MAIDPLPRTTWRARPALAIGLRLLVTLVPIFISLGTTVALRSLIPPPHGIGLRLAWIAGLLTCAVGVALGVERFGRRLLPLITLLKLSMLFPDQAPSRFAIARAAGSVRKLEERLTAAEREPEAGEETRTASLVLALAVALQSHDRRTRGHSERVRVYTDLLGEELQLPVADRYRLRWAALLHDIGKLTIASRILNKPGALDDTEWRKMKQHPSEGSRIAAPLLEWLGLWGNAIIEHHERFDGNGYPGGIRGDAISLAGRIVAVADSYDTMTAARSYKKPMAVWTARRELADCAGGQFDPEMVRAFLSISIPKLLWKTGPVSLLVQLPFLARLQQVGLESVTAMTQGVAVVTVAAGVTAMAAAPLHHAPQAPVRTGATVSASVSSAPGVSSPSPDDQPRPTPTVTPAPSTTPGVPTPSGDPVPTSSPSPATPTGTPTIPTPTPLPTTLPSPPPTELPSLPPLPIPTPSLPPLPIPTPSLPPLPLPTPPLAPNEAHDADGSPQQG